MKPLSFIARFVSARIAFSVGALLAGGAVLRAQPVIETEGPTIMLAPLLVEESRIPLKWRYFSMPGREVLAACDDRIAANIIQRVRMLDEMMEAVLPARFMAAAALPETLILIEEKAAQQAMADIVRKDGARARFMPNLRLNDRDSVAIFALVTEASATRFVYTQDRIMSLLERRVPRLPDWFLEGVRGFYGQMQFGDQEIQVGPASWLSSAETAALRTDPDRPRVLLPMAELFAGRGYEGGPRELPAEWRAQATLFIRWAMLENGGAAKEALWTLVDRLEQEPPSEALVRELFGLGYADIRDELSDYLSSATRQRATIPAPPASGRSPPRARFRPATDLEIARIRGEWERLEIPYARANSPTHVERYVTQARKTFHRAYDPGERDPQLLAAMGLMEIDAGNPAAARPLLEAAVAGRVVRPRAYFELGRLRYVAITPEFGTKEKLSAAQVAAVLEPLLEGQRQEPPLLENYLLMADVVGRSEAPPTAAQLAALHDGALRFSHVSELVARTIYFHLTSNQPAAAAVLSNAGLRYARDPAMRARFERASATLSGAKPPESK